MKNIFSLCYIVGYTIILGGFFGSFSLASYTPISDCSSSSICGAPAEPFKDLMDFVREMTNSIKTVGTEGDFVGKYVNPDRFKGNVFQPPQDIKISAVGTLARKITSKLTFSLALVSIFTNPVQMAGLNDFGGLFSLLLKNHVYLRDIKLVRDRESLLTTKKYELGIGGGRYTKINAENTKIMNDIIAKYVKKGLFDSSTNVNNHATYKNIIAALNQLIASSKRFIYVDEIGGFKEIDQGLFSDMWENSIIIKFASGPLDIMYTDYECARGLHNICNASLQKFSKDMKNLRTSTQDGRGMSIDTITRSTRALQNTLSDIKKEDTKQAEARENDLVRAMYGSQSLGKGGFNFTQNNGNVSRADIKKGASGIAGLIADFSSGVIKIVKRISGKKTLNEKKDEIETSTSTSTYTNGGYDVNNAFVAIILGYTSDVFVNQILDMQTVAFVEVKDDTTPNFGLLGQQIYAIKDKILGGKDQPNTLIWSLGNACEAQCSKQGGKCR